MGKVRSASQKAQIRITSLMWVSPEVCHQHCRGSVSWLRRIPPPSELKTSLVGRVGSVLQTAPRIRCWWVVLKCGFVEVVQMEGSRLGSRWSLSVSDLNSPLRVYREKKKTESYLKEGNAESRNATREKCDLPLFLTDVEFLLQPSLHFLK